MRRTITLCAAVLACGSLLVPASAPASAASASGSVRTGGLSAGHQLVAGSRLVSPDRRYAAVLTSAGRLAVRTSTGRAVWHTGPAGRHARLVLGRRGELALFDGHRVEWHSRTTGSGAHDVLRMRDDGVLALTSGRALVWSSRFGNRCPSTAGKVFAVDVGSQQGRACRSGQQVRAFPVTTGAVDRGDGTPYGTWRVQAKVRNTVLHPAAGGAYHVHYWMPYDGPYGVHDSPWQKFAYGSQRYRTHGSHGCTHVPGRSMAWLFRWARIGTTVTVHG